MDKDGNTLEEDAEIMKSTTGTVRSGTLKMKVYDKLITEYRALKRSYKQVQTFSRGGAYQSQKLYHPFG